MNASDRLCAAVAETGTCLCVGIDPWPDRLPGRAGMGASPTRAALALAAEDFGHCVVDAAAGLVPAVKPQFAFFEALGPAGMGALASVCAHARERGLFVIGDAKRGDIGSTAQAYADATLTPGAPFPCDALTVSPFLGPDSLTPFLTTADAHDRALFVLLRTSNPGSARWQAPVRDDLAGWLHEESARRARRTGLSSVGVVVGATRGPELAELRERLPHAWFLVPGFGAQGASASDALRASRPDGAGALVVSARGATFPDGVDAAYDADPAAWIHARIRAVIRELAC